MEELFGDDNGGVLDSEEELSDHLDSPTQELPGLGEEDEENEVDADASKEPAEPKSLKAAGADDMRGAYWDFIHQEQKKLKKESPEMSGREILKLARERWLTCDVRMASVSKYSKSEKSRDPLAHTIQCRWVSDNERVVLEMASESSKSTSDASPCSIRSLLHELEEANVVDTGIHCHECQRPGAQDASKSGADYFVIKPGKNIPTFSYTPTLSNLKFATLASIFTREALAEPEIWEEDEQRYNVAWSSAEAAHRCAASQSSWTFASLLYAFFEFFSERPVLQIGKLRVMDGHMRPNPGRGDRK
eukprot:s810_g5.t1